MNNQKPAAGLFIIIALISLICLSVICYNRSRINVLSLAPLQPTVVSLPSSPPTPLPTPVPRLPKIVAAQINPDDSYTLKLKVTPQENSSVFTLLYTAKNDQTDEQLFSTALLADQTWSIPFNTWSPDNKYVFIQEDRAGLRDYLVFPLSSPSSAVPLHLAALFQEKYPDYVLREVTGWAGSGLLILNTQTKNGETGPSFWFGPAAKTFTQLSTRF